MGRRVAQTKHVMIVGLTGPNAAGKGEVAHYLEGLGFTYYSLSDVVREEASARGLDHSRENLIRVGNELRARFGAGVLADRIVARIREEGEADVQIVARDSDDASLSSGSGRPSASARNDPGVLRGPDSARAGAIRAIVDSVRSPAEVAVLRRAPGFVLLGINAPVAMRFERSRRRARIGDGATLEEFTRKERLENSTDPAAQQLSETLRLADIVIDNSGTLEELHVKVAEVLNLEDD